MKETYLRPRYQETDQMGVVYHSNYIIWFEVGRTEYFRELELPYTLFEERGVYLPVVEVNCRYLCPAHYDDRIAIRTRVNEFSGVRVRFVYDIVNLDTNKVLVKGYTLHAFVGREGRPINLYKKHPDLAKKIAEVLENDA